MLLTISLLSSIHNIIIYGHNLAQGLSRAPTTPTSCFDSPHTVITNYLDKSNNGIALSIVSVLQMLFLC